ncbi:hypothetical protein UM719_00195 (plasmid) [Staphylococcus aureus]|nr:hypothetical protein UM719_00195 [Staphylococcus aureus]
MADNKMGGFDTHIKTEEDVPTVTRKRVNPKMIDKHKKFIIQTKK